MIRWGLTLTQIEAKYSDGDTDSDDTEEDSSYSVTIDNYEKIEGTSSLVTFKFHEDSLSEISAIVMTDDDILPYYKALQKLKHHYKELYGNPDEDDFSLIWETKKSTITLWNYRSLILFEYEDVNYIK